MKNWKDQSPIKQIENVWLSPTLQGGGSLFKKMVEPSEIELWRTNHVDKDGKFVNDKAKETYEKMIELKDTAVQEGETTMTEAEILEVILGHRPGYKKGMGSGVEVSRVTKRLRAQEIGSS
ncbi:hypothetical protein OROMI_001428 [Orobanche minor]